MNRGQRHEFYSVVTQRHDRRLRRVTGIRVFCLKGFIMALFTVSLQL